MRDSAPGIEREFVYPVTEYPAGTHPSWHGVLNRLPGSIWDYEGVPCCITRVQMSFIRSGWFCVHFSPALAPNEGLVRSFCFDDQAPFRPWTQHLEDNLLDAAASHPILWSQLSNPQRSFYSVCKGVDEVRRIAKMYPGASRRLADSYFTKAYPLRQGDLISHFCPDEQRLRRIHGIAPGESMTIKHITCVDDREPPEYRQYIVAVEGEESDVSTVLRIHDVPAGAVIVDAETLKPLSFVRLALPTPKRGEPPRSNIESTDGCWITVDDTKPPEINPLPVVDVAGAARVFGVKNGELGFNAGTPACKLAGSQYTCEEIRVRSNAGELFRLHPDCRPGLAANGSRVPKLRRLQLLDCETDYDIYCRTSVVTFAVCQPGREDSYWYLREETPRTEKLEDLRGGEFRQHMLVPFSHPLSREEIIAANDRGMEMHDRGDGVVRLGPPDPTYTSPFSPPPTTAISLPDGDCSVKEEEKDKLARDVYAEVMKILSRGPTGDERRWIRNKVKELTYLMPYAAKAEAVNCVLAAQAGYRHGMRDAPIPVGTVTGRFSSKPNIQGMPKISEKDLVPGGKMSEEQSKRTTKSFTEVLLKYIGERAVTDADALFLKLSRDSFERGNGSTISDGGTTIRDRLIAERWRTPLFKPIYCKRCGHGNGCMHGRQK